VDLQGAPPPKGTNATCKHNTGHATTSTATPAEALLLPTLCTRRDPAIPHPPAAGAAAGGRGITRIAGGEVGTVAGFRKTPLSTVREGGERSKVVL
jgi:hypothetical protein